MKKAIYAGGFFLPSGQTGPGYLPIENGKFGQFSPDKPADATQIIDCGAGLVAPGLVDTHIHGLMGFDVMDNSPEGLAAMSLGLLSTGVTSFLPTTLTASAAQTTRVVTTIGGCYAGVKGAKIRGIFLEGPFFTEKFKGAQNSDYLQEPCLEKLADWQKASGGLVRKVGLAPEAPGATAFVAGARALGIHVALGHSAATFLEAKASVDAGATIFIHTFNGMSPLSHREPGMVGAALTLRDVFCELICDGHHVNPAAAGLVMRCVGHGHTAMVTDCMRAGQMPDGDYLLGELTATVTGGAARLAGGSLAGSVLRLVDAVKNVVEWGLATPAQAIAMATIVPAQSVGIEDCCGQILPGHAADFIVLTKEMDLLATYVDGFNRTGD